jgi:hypothetical protein
MSDSDIENDECQPDASQPDVSQTDNEVQADSKEVKEPATEPEPEAKKKKRIYSAKGLAVRRAVALKNLAKAREARKLYAQERKIEREIVLAKKLEKKRKLKEHMKQYKITEATKLESSSSDEEIVIKPKTKSKKKPKKTDKDENDDENEVNDDKVLLKNMLKELKELKENSKPKKRKPSTTIVNVNPPIKENKKSQKIKDRILLNFGND